MHPKLITALAGEMERDRRSERHTVSTRSLTVGRRPRGYGAPRAADGILGRLRVGLSPRARLS
jgi:hypothetical protein